MSCYENEDVDAIADAAANPNSMDALKSSTSHDEMKTIVLQHYL